MYPILFHINGFTLYTYGLFVALGFMTLMVVSRRYADGISSDALSDIFFVILVSALIGARLMYVILNFEAYQHHLVDILKVWNGGLVFFGGFLAAVPAVALYLKIKGIDIWKTADGLSPGMALGHAVGRLGCFFAGCCYGKECSLPTAVRFTHPESLAPLNIGLHPTQIYEVFSNLVLFIILVRLMKKKKTDGIVFLIYIILYSLFRSVIEFYRGDFRGDFFFHFISVSQGIGVLVSLGAGILLFMRLRSSHDADPV